MLIYTSFSVPAVVAGVAVTAFGLEATTNVYGVAVMALAAATTVAVSRHLATVTRLGPSQEADPRPAIPLRLQGRRSTNTVAGRIGFRRRRRHPTATDAPRR